MDTYTPPTDRTIVGTYYPDDGEPRPATVADLDALIEDMNRAQRAATARAVVLGVFRTRTTTAPPRRTREHRSPSTTRTTSRRARTTSATSTADPSSSRGRLSASALGHLRIETTRLGLRLALIGIGGAR